MRLVTIRRSLYVSLLLAILLLGGALLAAVALASRTALRGLATDWIEQTTRLIESSLTGFFEPLRSGLLVAGAWGEGGLLAPERQAALAELVGPVMRRFPQIAAVRLADARGNQEILHRDGDQAPHRSTRPQVEDARQELWYRGAAGRHARLGSSAAASDRVHWTAPYRLPGGQEPAISASIAFNGPDGELRVLAFELLLVEVSRFTSAIGIREHGVVFVLDEEDRLVGLPRHTRFQDAAVLGRSVLARMGEIDMPVLAAAVEAARAESFEDGARFTAGGSTWWTKLRQFPLSDQRALTIAVAVPQNELISGLEQLRLTIVLLTTAAVALAAWRAAQLAKRFGEPIEALVRESDRISRGKLEAVEHPVTPVVEFRRLARAHDRMRESLRGLLDLESELQVARQIQQSAWPDRLPELPGFELAAGSEPAREAGGDTYDAIGVVPDATLGFPRFVDTGATQALMLLADATGHGVGPALSAAELRAMVRIALRVGCEPANIVRQVNAQMHDDLPEGRFVTVWFGALDSTKAELTSFSAGQAPLLHYVASRDAFDVLGSDTHPIGIAEDLKVVTRPPIALGHGDVFAVLSDGFHEATGPGRERFGIERTKEVIRAARLETASEILAALRTAVDAFAAGEPQSDDRTAIVIKRR